MGEFGKYKGAIARNNHSMEVQELQSKIEQLEKRIAKTLDMLEGDLSYVEEDSRRNFDFLQMAMIRCLKDDIKALRGDSCG